MKKPSNKNIIGTADYLIDTLKSLKKGLIQADSKNKELIWAVGGLIFLLNATLLQTCQQVILDVKDKENPSAKKDLQEIQSRFNTFIGEMINGE
jgi:hypothetical protein